MNLTPHYYQMMRSLDVWIFAGISSIAVILCDLIMRITLWT